ncbi:MAG: T9SS type A sorting domain-containing protein [Ginsengibacter sp.]
MRKIFLLLLVVCTFQSKAQWSTDPQIADTKVFTGADYQNHSFSIADGSGGAIVFWESRDALETNFSINYNHLNSSGVADWASVTTGLTIATGADYRSINQVISDGSGGAFIAWEVESTNYQVLVQHISSTGAQLWTSGGVLLSGNGYTSYICSDGSGGIIGAWSDDQYDPVNNFPRTYAQRISAAGTPMWAAGGIRVVNTTSFDACIGLVPDGSGGAVIAMLDTRNNVYNPVTIENSNIDIYAQRLNALGVNQWAAAGVPVCTNTFNQLEETGGYTNNFIISDGTGGAIITWEDYRNDPNNGNVSPILADIFAQKINASGVAQWTTNGVAVSTSTDDQSDLNIFPDGAAGAVITWQNAPNYGLYIQKLNSAGVAQWTANGKNIVSDPGGFLYSSAIDESGNNILVAWTANTGTSAQNITAQKISISTGSFLWGTGTLVCGRADDQSEPFIINDGAGGAIISWTDQRTDADIYANRVPSSGSLPVNFIDFTANMQGTDVRLDWSTATESNTQYFGVEKSNDGTHFNETAKVNAAGNSTIEKHYQYIDVNAFENNPVLYYRIRSTDRDGKAFYSKIRQVKNNAGLSQKVKLITNPVKADAQIEYVSPANTTAVIKIIDQQGRIVLSSSVNIFKGTNKISLSTQSLAGGIYTIILSGNEAKSKLKMVKE